MIYFNGSALKKEKEIKGMFDTKNIYIKTLSCLFIFLLVVLSFLNKNRVDYIYLGSIFILILKIC